MLFRSLPKSDTKYEYFTGTSPGSGALETDVLALRTNARKLASDGLTSTALTVYLSEPNIGNGDAANKLYLLANPFMTHLNMKSFFEINTMFEPAYWLMTEGTQVGVFVDKITTVSGSTKLSIAPMQGFFVRLATGEANPTVTYTVEMMTDPLPDGSGPLDRKSVV